MSLRGQVALITGIDKTLPSESARQLAKEGAELALHYNSTRSRDQALRFRDELRRTHPGIRISIHDGDLSSAAAVEQLFNDVVDEHRRVDFVVNTAGTVLNNKKLFTYSVFVDGQKNKWTDRYTDAHRLQASSCESRRPYETSVESAWLSPVSP